MIATAAMTERERDLFVEAVVWRVWYDVTVTDSDVGAFISLTVEDIARRTGVNPSGSERSEIHKLVRDRL